MMSAFRMAMVCTWLCICQNVWTQVRSVEFVSEGIPLNAYMYEARGDGPKPLLIWLHGNPGSPEEGRSAWVETLMDQGINVFKFNYRGLWGNAGEFNLGNSVEDLSNAIDLLTTDNAIDEYGIDRSRIIAGGYSFGTAVALVGALNDKRITQVICIMICDHSYFGRQWMDPYSPIKGFLEDATEALFLPSGVIPQEPHIFIDDLTDHIYRYDFVEHAENLLDKKISIFGGINDMICPIEDHLMPVYRKLRHLGHQDLHVMIANCTHDLDCEDPVELADILLGFIRDDQ